MIYPTISDMAEAGFLFAPTAMGMTRSNREGWPQLATNNKETLLGWILEGNNLVSVTKHGHGFAIDIDDVAAVQAKGFKMEWLDGYYLVDTPSGGLHCHGLHTTDTEALGNLIVVYDVKGESKSKKIFELKLNNQSVAAPTATRVNQPKKRNGEYKPRSTFDTVRRGLPAVMLVWIKQYSESQKAPVAKGEKYTTEFHPQFSMDDFLDHHECTECTSGEVDGALHVVVETCPVCGKDANGSTLRAGISKFIFGGNGFGYICHACGIASREELDERMDETNEDWEPWDEFIYRHDDRDLFIQDAVDDPDFPVELIEGDSNGDEESTKSVDASPATALKLEEYTYEHSDMGNGERLVRKYGRFLRYVAETGQWMVWGKDGRGWREDTKGTLVRLTKRIIEEIRAEAKAKFTAAYNSEDGKVDDEVLEEAKAIARFALASSRIDRHKAMVASAGFESGIITNFNDWDADGWLLNVENGIIDLRTQSFRQRTQSDLCIKRSPVVFDPEAKCPLWESVMAKWMCGDLELVEYLQIAWGMSLTSDTGLQSLFFNHGGGMNGKDTAFNTLLFVFGSYAQSANFMTFAETKNHSEHRNDLAVLAGASRLLTTCESSDGHSLDEGIIKLVTGCSPVTCRHVHGKPFTYVPQYKLWMMSNYEPVIKGNDWGIWRRVKKIPWNYTVTEDEKDPNLTEKLQAEASGILNWLLTGLNRYVELGKKLPSCKAVEEATAKYRKEMDIIGRFAEQCLEFEATRYALGPMVYRAYKWWCKENGCSYMSSRRFYAEFRKRYGLEEQDVNRGTAFYGVWLLGDCSTYDDD
jgi:putative DNA primase/helicase